MKSFLPFKSYREWSIKPKLITITSLLLLGSVFLNPTYPIYSTPVTFMSNPQIKSNKSLSKYH